MCLWLIVAPSAEIAELIRLQCSFLVWMAQKIVNAVSVHDFVVLFVSGVIQYKAILSLGSV